MATIECERCGFQWEINAIRKRVNLCASCRARKVQTVHTGKGKCIPWHGYFAETKSHRSTMTANPSYPASDPAAEKIVSPPAMCAPLSVATNRLEQNRKG